MAFVATLRQLNEFAVHREEFAENLNAQIVAELSRYTQELKTERKTVNKNIVNVVKVNQDGLN